MLILLSYADQSLMMPSLLTKSFIQYQLRRDGDGVGCRSSIVPSLSRNVSRFPWAFTFLGHQLRPAIHSS